MAPIHLSTILTRSPAKLVDQFAQLSLKYGGKGNTVLFALSANFSRPEDLQETFNGLTKFNDVDSLPDIQSAPRKGKGKALGHVIGCLTDTFASVSFEDSENGRKVKASKCHEDPLLSCSIGVFSSDHCIPFRSTLAGREQPQVGRWHALRKQDAEDSHSKDRASSIEHDLASADWERMKNGGRGEVNWENIWNRSEPSQASTSSSISPSILGALPESLRSIQPSQIKTLLTLSSPHPDTLTNAFSNFLSSQRDPTNAAAALTLVATPTHFVTGRAVTLFMDGEIFSEGAVGIALLYDEEPFKEASNSGPTVGTDFLGVKKISGPMTITSREGNMINALDESNPTRLLLDALELAGLGSNSSSPLLTSSFKDNEQFALGVLEANGQVSRIYKITAGDPSSRAGSLSLDAQRAPDVGTVIQFLHCPANVPLTVPSSLFPSSSRHSDDRSTTEQLLAFLTVPESVPTQDILISEGELEDPTDTRILDNTFLAPSTQGFIMSQSSSTSSIDPGAPISETTGDDIGDSLPSVQGSSATPWTCSVPGGMVAVQWSS